MEMTDFFCPAIPNGKLILMITGAGRRLGEGMARALAHAACGGMLSRQPAVMVTCHNLNVDGEVLSRGEF